MKRMFYDNKGIFFVHSYIVSTQNLFTKKIFLITEKVGPVWIKSIIWWAQMTQLRQVQLWFCWHFIYLDSLDLM